MIMKAHITGSKFQHVFLLHQEADCDAQILQQDV